MSEKVLLAGATGRLGRHVRSELESRVYKVRALVRDPCNLAGEDIEVLGCDARNAESVRGACDGVASVISALGASLALQYTPPKAGYKDVDLGANLNLLAEAKRAGVRRFVYVSLYGAESLRGFGYVDAHEEFVEALAASGIECAVVRPTGFFYVFEEVFKMARRGRALLVGSGEARTNPIHEADVARACVEALESDVNELNVGGPEVYTRREVALLAFEALGKKPKLTSLPPGFMRSLIKPMKVFDRRLYDLLDFGAAVSTTDVVAPAYGTRNLREHFRRLASGVDVE